MSFSVAARHRVGGTTYPVVGGRGGGKMDKKREGENTMSGGHGTGAGYEIHTGLKKQERLKPLPHLNDAQTASRQEHSPAADRPRARKGVTDH